MLENGEREGSHCGSSRERDFREVQYLVQMFKIKMHAAIWSKLIDPKTSYTPKLYFTRKKLPEK